VTGCAIRAACAERRVNGEWAGDSVSKDGRIVRGEPMFEGFLLLLQMIRTTVFRSNPRMLSDSMSE